MASIREEELVEIRQRLGLSVFGEGKRPIVPALRFSDLRLPSAMNEHLAAEEFNAPTGIQSQILPAMFMGRGSCVNVSSWMCMIFFFSLLQICLLLVLYKVGRV